MHKVLFLLLPTDVPTVKVVVLATASIAILTTLLAPLAEDSSTPVPDSNLTKLDINGHGINIHTHLLPVNLEPKIL